MKHLSVKWRVTLWFAGFMAVVMAAVVIVIALATASMNRAYVGTNLMRCVAAATEEIEMEGYIEIDDLDDFPGVIVLVYDMDGSLLFGKKPDGLGDVPFMHGRLQSAMLGGSPCYVYDSLFDLREYGDVWIRGISSLEVAAAARSNVLTVALALLPLLLLAAVAGGYLVTKRALDPLKRITASMESITGGRDLSRRIRYRGVKDELYELAAIFDGMLDRLQRSFEAERRFTSDASHELRTPASVILAQCEYALTQAGTEEERLEALSAVRRQALRMTGLISRLLSLARMDANRQSLELEEVDMSDLASIVSDEMEEEAPAGSIFLVRHIEPGIVLRCDRTLMGRVWINLISNALKYGGRGGKVAVTLRREDGGIFGSVADDGPGIAPCDQEAVWERFFRRDASRGDDGSFGLGLPMVRWIVEAHGGSAALESEPGRGSVFSFRIPFPAAGKKNCRD